MSAHRKLGRDDALRLLRQVQQVTAAKGKKVLAFDLGTASTEEVLAAMLGRTGNLRAPVLRVGDRLFVGFPRGGFAELA